MNSPTTLVLRLSQIIIFGELREKDTCSQDVSFSCFRRASLVICFLVGSTCLFELLDDQFPPQAGRHFNPLVGLLARLLLLADQV